MRGAVAERALIFDFDGLILDTEWPEFQSVSEEFERHGVSLPLAEWRTVVGTAEHIHWLDWLDREVGGVLDREVAIARRRERHHQLISEREVEAGVVELLEEADVAGIPLAVASSSPVDWVDGHLRRLGLRERFGALRCRGDVAVTKPAPDLYLAAVAAVGADPQRSVALEDSEHGCVAAKAAGMYCVAVPNDVTRGSSFEAADLVLDSLAELSVSDLWP